MTEWNLNPAKTALLIVDVQNDYAHPDGYLGRRLGAGIQEARKILPPLRRVIDTCKLSNVLVVWIQSIRTDEDCERARHKITPPRFNDGWLGGPKKDSFGSQIVEEIRPMSSDDLIVQKWRNSAFYRTDLEEILKSRNIDTLLMTGIATNVCVESTFRDAYFRDFDIVLVKDCCFSHSREEHLGAIRRVENSYGAVAESEEVIRKIGELKVIHQNRN